MTHRNILTSTLFTYSGIENCSLIDKYVVIKVADTDLQRGYGVDNSEYDRGELSPRESHEGFIVKNKVGYINYDSGEIFLENFRPTSINDGSEYIYISVKPRIDDVLPEGNTIVTIEPSDINVTEIDDTDRLEQMKSQSY